MGGNEEIATLRISTERCKSCGYCILACPSKALRLSGQLNKEGYDYVANDERKYGYIDTSGAVVIPMTYDAAFGAGDGLFSVGQYTGDRILYGLVDTENNVVVPLEYEDISSCGDGVAYAVKDGKVVILRVQ